LRLRGRWAVSDLHLVGPPLTDRDSGNGAAILDELLDTITTYSIFPTAAAAHAYVLWIAATHAQTSWEHATRFVLKSPIKRCGKTRAQEVGRELVHNPIATTNISVAALVRSIDEKDPPTLFLDEADTIFARRRGELREGAEDIRGIVNSGHSPGWPYIRWNMQTRQAEECPTFAMVLLASIGDMPDTIEDRAIVVSMRRRAAAERLTPFRRRRVQPHLQELRERLHDWVTGLDLEDVEPDLPVEDRDADKWEPLVAIADAAGGEWPARARMACLSLCGDAPLDEGTAGELLLADLRAVFGEREAVHTKEALNELHRIDESPWGAWGTGEGHLLRARELAALLRPYGIRSKNVRINERQAKGYERADMEDAWLRYVPAVPPSQEPESAGDARDGIGTEDVFESVPPAEQGKEPLGDAGTDGTLESVDEDDFDLDDEELERERLRRSAERALEWAQRKNWPKIEIPGATIETGEPAWRAWIDGNGHDPDLLWKVGQAAAGARP
jgi:hypothetical protein